jgi:CheY-specific phosphatase CheX
MSTVYADKIHDIALNTFEIASYMFPLEEWELDDAEDREEPDGSVKAIVHFDGAAEGGMVINPSGQLLSALAANMLGTDTVDEGQREGALCEIANIICGNTVPLFADSDRICFIRPPQIANQGEDTDQTFKGMKKESTRVLLDEGIAEITIYYSTKGKP